MKWYKLLAAPALLLTGCTKVGPGDPFTYVEATIDEVQTAISAGRTSCVDVVRGYLRRIDAYDRTTGLNAVIFTNPDAVARAAEIDGKIAAGETPGPLFCVPVLLKDNFDTDDMPTSGGSIALKNECSA